MKFEMVLNTYLMLESFLVSINKKYITLENWIDNFITIKYMVNNI